MSLLDGPTLLRDTPEFPFWERRLRDECARSGRFGRSFALVLLAVDAEAVIASTPLPPAFMDALGENLRSGVRAADLVAQVGPALFAVTLIGATVATGRPIAARLVVRMHDAARAAASANRVAPVACGVAIYGPEFDGPDQFVAAAEADLAQAIEAALLPGASPAVPAPGAPRAAARSCDASVR